MSTKKGNYTAKKSQENKSILQEIGQLIKELMDIFEQMVTSADEYKALEKYRKNMDQMLALEEQVDRLTAEIKRISFAEGPRNMEYLNKLKALKQKAINDLNRFAPTACGQ